mgnify:CR=1 FL=1
MSKPVLEIENLSVSFMTRTAEVPAVMDFSMEVNEGDAMGLVGESGCGKSLTSLAIMDLLPKKAIRTVNKMSLNDENILNFSEKQMSNVRGNKMGMIFQEFALVERLTVMENVLSGRLGYVGFLRSFFRKFPQSEM